VKSHLRNRYIGAIVAAAALTAVLAMVPANSSAQSDPATSGKAAGKGLPPGGSLGNEKAPPGPTPHTQDGKVDLSGVWDPGFSFANIGQVPLQPWADAIYKERRATLSKDDPEGHCLPAGVPRISPFPQKFVQTPNLVVILDEGNVHSYRQLFLDRGHPKDLDPLWMGDSIAKWDGDALVVDTIGFNDKTWLNGQGLPHSDALHVVERYRRPDFGHLEVEITIDDSKAFTAPHTFKRTFTLLPKWEIHEYVCTEFNVDAEHLVGK
jgi:hypothetical protein